MANGMFLAEQLNSKSHFMTHYEFLGLTDAQQAATLIKQGVRVARRTDKSYHYTLYQLDSFYVEGKVDVLTGRAKDIRSFTSTDLLLPYLDNLDLTGF